MLTKLANSDGHKPERDGGDQHRGQEDQRHAGDVEHLSQHQRDRERHRDQAPAADIGRGSKTDRFARRLRRPRSGFLGVRPKHVDAGAAGLARAVVASTAAQELHPARAARTCRR